jgi:hypothetical protein
MSINWQSTSFSTGSEILVKFTKLAVKEPGSLQLYSGWMKPGSFVGSTALLWTLGGAGFNGYCYVTTPLTEY